MNPAGHPQAVFLSYSRLDMAAARRIADALAAFDVEVWFDQDGLEGGDAWDQKIRRQIKECALFIPVISANTQAQREGYFRLEWKLAEERTHLMADGTSFLLPVAIDETPATGALVPESFLKTQWTRLPRGVPGTAFVERVRALLEKPQHAALPAAGRPELKIAGQPEKRVVGIAMAVALLIAAGGWFWLQRPGAKPSVPDAAANPALSAKSIAVLPFTNMSEDKENGYFADGVQEDILTSLQNIGDLQVISRTSVGQYRDTKKTIRQIGVELGVAYVLEGSVQRAGDTVRVTGQLIDARTEGHVWAQHYDRAVALKDIFAVQTALAEEIASALKAKLSPGEKSRLERAPTTNTAAYDNYLRAREILNNEGRNLDTLTRAEPLFQSAVDLDPNFAAAWGELAVIQTPLYRRAGDKTRPEKARRAIETMERLAPDDPETWLKLATYYLAPYAMDYARSDGYLERAARALPNNGLVALLQAEADRRNGRAVDVLVHYRKAYELDRRNSLMRTVLFGWLLDIRRYDEVVRLEREDPGSDGYYLALLPFYERGSTREMDAWFATHPEANSDALSTWRFFTGNAAEYIKLLDEARQRSATGMLRPGDQIMYANALTALGETVRAQELARAIEARRKAEPDNLAPDPGLLILLGEKQAAIDTAEAARAAEQKAGINRNLVRGGWDIAFILAQTGEKDRAVAEFARLLKIPSGLNVYIIRNSWALKAMQGYPPFEALLNDPKNNAPLL